MLMSGGLIQEGIQEGMQKGRLEGMQEGMQKGMQKGILKGMQEGKLETAQNLVRLGIPYEKIAAATGLTEAELRKKLANKNTGERRQSLP